MNKYIIRNIIINNIIINEICLQNIYLYQISYNLHVLHAQIGFKLHR